MSAEDKDIEDDLIIDTSKMNAKKAEAMEVAESARQTEWTYPSFCKEIFMGSFRPELITPFPEQSEKEKAIGDELIKKVGKLLREKLDGEEVDATRTIPEDVVQELKAMGLFAMKVSKKYGGLGLSQVNYNRIMAAVASWCGSTAVLLSAHQSIGVPQPLKEFGTEEQKQQWLPRFREGAVSAFALTEPEAGSDPARLATTAKLSKDGENYIINGQKLWCTNGPIADLMVVMARTAPKTLKSGREVQQITAFVVEGNTPGIEVVHRCDFMGIRAIQNGLLKFTDVKVPKENIVAGTGKGLKIALSTLNVGRLTLPAASAGMAKQCLNIARRWGNEREQWGAPIGKHEAGAGKIAFIASSTFAMDAVTQITSHWADQGNVDIRLEAAMAKLFNSEMAWKVVDETLQLRAGRGYEKASSLKDRGETPFPVERMLRDCRINRIIEGTSEIMKLFLSREAMDPHLKVAAKLIKKHVPLDEKLRAGIKLAGFYSTWYPTQWVNKGMLNNHENMGKLARHFQYIESASHRLARSIFHAMGLYQDRLERKQLLLGRLMDIGTELFAMAATCAYADGLLKKNPENLGPQYLADVFCLAARRRSEKLFDELNGNDDLKTGKLAQSVLEGDLDWLEKDIYPVE